jgi:hypothetical protein
LPRDIFFPRAQFQSWNCPAGFFLRGAVPSAAAKRIFDNRHQFAPQTQRHFRDQHLAILFISCGVEILSKPTTGGGPGRNSHACKFSLFPEEMIVAKICGGQDRPRETSLAAEWLNKQRKHFMSTRISSIGLFAASVAACSLFLTGAATGRAAPVVSTVPVVQAGPVVAGPAVHKIHGRIVAVTPPASSAAANVGPTITVELRHRQSPASDSAGFVVEKKTFPIAAGAPIELIAGGTTQPLTPAALQPGRRTALLVSDGVVNEIDLFARKVPTVNYYTNGASYAYSTPFRIFSTGWFGRTIGHYAGWSHFHSWNGGGHRGGAGGFVGHKVVHHGRSIHGVASVSGVHVHQVSHRTGKVHHTLAVHHAHAGHHVHSVSYHHAGHHKAGHHAHNVKHSQRSGLHHGGHRGGHHHKK